LRRRDLVVETLLISPSGALSPGPLSAMAVAAGLALGALGGLAIALGHTLFELPYVALLLRLASRLRRSFTGTLGRIMFLVMGASQPTSRYPSPGAPSPYCGVVL